MIETDPGSSPLPRTDVVEARPVSRAEPGVPVRPPSPLELPALSRRSAALDLGLIALVALVVPYGVRLVLLFTAADVSVDELAIPLLTVQKWFDVALAAGLTLYVVLRHALPPTSFGLRHERPLGQLSWSLAGVAAAYGWLVATMLLLGFLMMLFPKVKDAVLERRELLGLMPVHNLLATVLLLVPVAVHEELLFRGLLLPYLRRALGHWPAAIVVSSSVFAVLHFDQGWVGVLQVFGLGIVFSLIFLGSRSLLAVIVAHFLFDFAQFQLIRWMPDWVFEAH